MFYYRSSKWFPADGAGWHHEKRSTLQTYDSSVILIAFSFAAAALCMLVCSLYVCAPLPSMK